MTEPPSPVTGLVTQDVALARLLEDLLGEVPERDHSTTTETLPSAPVRGTDASLHSPLVNENRQAPLQSAGPDPGSESLVPDWAAVGFRALVFRIGAQRFVIPLMALHSVVLLEQQLTELPGQPAWQIGVMRYRGQVLRIASMARLLGLADDCDRPRHALVLCDGQAGLACDRIDDAIDVACDTVRWRRPTASATWLRGIVADTLAAVLDPWVIEDKLGMEHA